MDATADTRLPREITSDTIGTTGWLTARGQDELTKLLADRKGVVFRGFAVTPPFLVPLPAAPRPGWPASLPR